MYLTTEQITEIMNGEHSYKIAYSSNEFELSRETLVFIHGWLGRRDDFQYIIDDFELDYNIIAIDLRGHGESEAPLSLPWRYEDYADDIYQVLNQFPITKATFIAYSLGTAITIKFIAKYPELVEKVVLIAGAPQIDIPLWGHLIARISFDMLVKTIVSIGEKIVSLAPESQYNEWYKDFLNRFKTSELKVHRKIYYETFNGDSVIEELKSINIPSLIITGDKDEIIDYSNSILMHDLIIGSQIEIVPEATHHIIFSHPLEIVEYIKDFLGETQYSISTNNNIADFEASSTSKI
jgi:long-chain acyl-CoA synthetase